MNDGHAGMDTVTGIPLCKQPTIRHLTFALMVAIVLVAFGLRAYRLDYQELRGDEAATWAYSIRSFDEMFHFYKTHAHPPLYYPLMHLWFPLAGTSEYALRFLPLVNGTFLVALLMALGARWFGWCAAVILGLLTTVIPYQIYFAQDARSYTLATWLGAASTLILWQALKQGRWCDWALYGALNLTLAYTHYYFFLIVVFQAVFVLWHTWQRRQMPWRYLAVGAAAGLAYLPWLIYVWEFLMEYSGNIDSPDFISAMIRPLLAFGGGQFLIPPLTWVNAGATTLLLIWGGVAAWHSNRQAALLTLLYLFGPLLTVFFASRSKEIFSERYLVLASPGFLLLLAVGIEHAFRHRDARLRVPVALLTVVFLGCTAYAAYNYYHNPAFAKSPPWRNVMNYIRRKSQPGDALIYTAALPEIIYYNERAARLPAYLIPYDINTTERGARDALQAIFAQHPRAWLIPIPAPDAPVSRLVEPWLERYSPRLDAVFFRAVHIGLYESPERFLKTMIPQVVDFAEASTPQDRLIRLEGFRFGRGDKASPTAKQGKKLMLTLVWKAHTLLSTDYTVFTHLIGPDGQMWGQWDNPPVRGTYPTSRWSVGERVFDQYAIPIDAQAPKGDYYVLVGLYEPTSGRRLVVLDADDQATGDAVRLNQLVTIP
ncbi:MAG: glycosyltransferase family 39 protein [Anaerolineae bacterium]|nr:glycosyltransferase family 39 protein [Anaerolineae bacterium]